MNILRESSAIWLRAILSHQCMRQTERNKMFQLVVWIQCGVHSAQTPYARQQRRIKCYKEMEK